MILRGKFHVVSGFPLHFILYRGNLDCFSNSVYTVYILLVNMPIGVCPASVLGLELGGRLRVPLDPLLQGLQVRPHGVLQQTKNIDC